MSFDEILDLTADVFYFIRVCLVLFWRRCECIEYVTHACVVLHQKHEYSNLHPIPTAVSLSRWTSQWPSTFYHPIYMSEQYASNRRVHDRATSDVCTRATTTTAGWVLDRSVRVKPSYELSWKKVIVMKSSHSFSYFSKNKRKARQEGNEMPTYRRTRRTEMKKEGNLEWVIDLSVGRTHTLGVCNNLLGNVTEHQRCKKNFIPTAPAGEREQTQNFRPLTTPSIPNPYFVSHYVRVIVGPIHRIM